MTRTNDACVYDQAHLETLPDGTIITWLRIPGDDTSEAVAFVRRETDPVQNGGIDHVVWITPGGWQPMSPEEAGINYPCRVIRFGDFNPEHYSGAELPLLGETLAECAHGGTWSREKALESATSIFCVALALRTPKLSLADLFADAEAIEAWLDRDKPEPAFNYSTVDPDGPQE